MLDLPAKSLFLNNIIVKKMLFWKESAKLSLSNKKMMLVQYETELQVISHDFPSRMTNSKPEFFCIKLCTGRPGYACYPISFSFPWRHDFLSFAANRLLFLLACKNVWHLCWRPCSAQDSRKTHFSSIPTRRYRGFSFSWSSLKCQSKQVSGKFTASIQK